MGTSSCVLIVKGENIVGAACSRGRFVMPRARSLATDRMAGRTTRQLAEACGRSCKEEVRARICDRIGSKVGAEVGGVKDEGSRGREGGGRRINRRDWKDEG